METIGVAANCEVVATSSLLGEALPTTSFRT